MSLAATVQRVTAITGSTGYLTPERGERLLELMFAHSTRAVLEIGHAHGASTAYLAAGLQALGVDERGALVTIDLKQASALEPRVEDFLADLGALDLTAIYREANCASWRLMKMLETDATPRFDLCFIDGAHTWSTDGFIFFLIDRLLRPGGWVVFDDLNWTVAASPTAHNTPTALALTEEERTTPQIRKVYELLVKTHPGYDEFRIDGEWALARKSQAPEGTGFMAPVRREFVYRESILSHLVMWLREQIANRR